MYSADAELSPANNLNKTKSKPVEKDSKSTDDQLKVEVKRH